MSRTPMESTSKKSNSPTPSICTRGSQACWGTQLTKVRASNVKLCCTCLRARRRRMKTNITLKLDAELLKEIRVLAAEQGTSISALLAERLEQIVRERKMYDRARRRALAQLRQGLDLRWKKPSSREELHDR